MDCRRWTCSRLRWRCEMLAAIPAAMAGLANLILTIMGAVQAGKWALRSKRIGGAVAKVAPKAVEWARRGKAVGAVANPELGAGQVLGVAQAPTLVDTVRKIGGAVRKPIQKYPLTSTTMATLLAAGLGPGQADKEQALEMISQMQGLDGGESAEGLRAALLMQLLEQANMNKGGVG